MKALNGFFGLISGGVCVVLMACATDESIDRETKVQLEPYSKIAEPTVGKEIHGLNKGKPQTTKVVAVKEGLITLTTTQGPVQGCTWTRGVGEGRFAPASSWKNCRNDSTGTQKFTKSGNIWPLAVGKSESYEVTGSDQKNNWQTTRKCEVKAAVQVTVQEKKYPTYEVVCKDDWNVRTWYISPDLQRTVKFKSLHHKRGVDNDWVAILE